MMKVHVQFKQNDILEGTSTIVADCDGLLQGDTLTFYEDEHTSDSIMFEDGEIHIERKGETHTRLALYEDKDGIVITQSPFGVMEFVAKVEKMEKANAYWMVEYRLYDGYTLIGHIRQEWTLRFSIDKYA